jgi:hypothetical protein
MFNKKFIKGKTANRKRSSWNGGKSISAFRKLGTGVSKNEYA